MLCKYTPSIGLCKKTGKKRQLTGEVVKVYNLLQPQWSSGQYLLKPSSGSWPHIDPHAPRMSLRNSFSNITRTPCPGSTPSTQQRHHTTLFNLFHPMISLVSSGVAGSLPTSRHIPTNASINSPLLVALAPFGK